MLKQVEVSKQNNSLAEIGQTNKTEFALCRYDAVKDQVIMCHQFVHCRDFLGDAIVAVESNRDMEIYGFQFNENNPRPSSENTELLLRLPDGCLANLQKNLQILKDIEDVMGWNKTYAEEVKVTGEKQAIVWVCGDKKWSQAGVAFSLYTFLLKCMTYKIKDPANWIEEIRVSKGTEAAYCNAEYLNWLFINLPTLVDKYPTFSGFKDQKKMDVNKIHNYIGFHSLRNVLWEKQPPSYIADLYKTHILSGYERVH